MAPTGSRHADTEKDKENLDRPRLYALLEVKPTASDKEIRTAYRRLAFRHHPDRGGDEEAFKEIGRAYEVLSDPEKRKTYDRLGEKGLEGQATGEPQDPTGGLLGALFGERGGAGPAARKKRPRTSDMVTPLRVSLEQLYTGCTKKMALSRKVVDKTKRAPKPCEPCDGRGVTVEVLRLGDMLTHAQRGCAACGGRGMSFTSKTEKEILELHIQKGAPDGHKLVFREKADEEPGADIGDVVFSLTQTEHPIFKRRGADLYVERKISLAEALCGFSMEFTHLDGRKLLIQSQPGDVLRPLPRGFDPLEEVGGGKSSKVYWEELTGFDAPGLENVAQAEISDPELLKRACESQLRRSGIEVAAFVVKDGRAYFKQGTREEVLEAKEPCAGASLYVVEDPKVRLGQRLMKAVKGEGMPTYKNPFVFGNLFLILEIEFPESLSPEQQEGLRLWLPQPAEPPRPIEDLPEDVELHQLVELDPVDSYNSNKVNMADQKGACDEDEEDGRSRGGVQCAQQ